MADNHQGACRSACLSSRVVWASLCDLIFGGIGHSTGSRYFKTTQKDLAIVAAWLAIKQLVVRLLAVWLLLTLPVTVAAAEKLHIAVAANFLSTLKVLVAEFERQSAVEVIISSGSTGKLYAQIVHGAPYDLYLAADRRHPALLVQQGLADQDSLIHYATGVLVLWSPGHQLSDRPLENLETDSFRKIAIADIRNAPYGQAGYSLLAGQGKLGKLKAKLVYGDSVSQVFHSVATGQVQAGFVAKSQLLDWEKSALGSRFEAGNVWEVPLKLYAPIAQYMVSLSRGHPVANARAFSQFIQSSWARDVIRDAGYQS